jgi:hypothetical protein
VVDLSGVATHVQRDIEQVQEAVREARLDRAAPMAQVDDDVIEAKVGVVLMTYQRIDRSPILTIGLGLEVVAADSRVSRATARVTTFTSDPPLRSAQSPVSLSWRQQRLPHPDGRRSTTRRIHP